MSDLGEDTKLLVIQAAQDLREALRPQQFKLAFFAIIVGAMSSYAAIGFRLWVEGTQFISFGIGGERLIDHVQAMPAWQVVGIPTLGGVVIALLLYLFRRPDYRAHTVQDVIAHAAHTGGRLSFKDGWQSALINATSLGFGASAGREGPVVHLGASLSGWLSAKLDLDPAAGRSLLGAGVAAAVAASFNAPIAGALFALEVVLGHYSLRAFAPITIAAVTGTLITRIHLGGNPAFIIPDYAVMYFGEYPLFILLGILSGLMATAFMRGTKYLQDEVERLPLPPYSLPVVGGLLLGVVALYLPHILGVGYDATDRALKGELSLGLLIALVLAKPIMTGVTLATRFGGGVFSPSLFMGAMLGGAFGMIATMFVPNLADAHGMFAIVGMGAVASAVLGAPISTILIVFELTGDYQIATALMVAVVFSSIVTQSLLGRSFFTMQLARKGLDLEGGFARKLARTEMVMSQIRDDVPSIPGNLIGEELSASMLELDSNAATVVDKNKQPIGILTYRTIRHITLRDEGEASAADLAEDVPILKPNDTLERAIAVMRAGNHICLPVADKAGYLGVCFARNALDAYAAALIAAEEEAAGERG